MRFMELGVVARDGIEPSTRGLSISLAGLTPPQLAHELVMRGLLAFRSGPPADLVEIDRLRTCHRHRLIKRLPIPPVIERSETIHYALCRRQNLDTQRTDRMRRPLPNQLPPHSERPRRKFERAGTDRVHKVPAGLADKSWRAQNSRFRCGWRATRSRDPGRHTSRSSRSALLLHRTVPR